MPLDPTGTALGALIVANLPPTEIPPSPAGVAAQLAHYQGVARAIIDYLIANAVVTTTVALPLDGVATILAPPGAAGGPCTGSGSGTGVGTIK